MLAFLLMRQVAEMHDSGQSEQGNDHGVPKGFRLLPQGRILLETVEYFE
jgi:hypothetical protein